MSASTSVSNNGEQAWKVYQNIDRVIRAKYPNPLIESSDLSMALQRLGQAVLNRYRLEPRSHIVERRWNIRLQFPPDSTPLSTTRDMIHLKIVQWESEIPREQAGHDVWTEGRTAAWRPQKSLQEALALPFEDLKTITEMTPERAVSIFTRIRSVVNTELKRLEAKDPSSAKMREIARAMSYLAEALNHKYHTNLDNAASLSDSQRVYVDSIDLYSNDSMLDAKVYKWSVRQALNLSSDNLFSRIFWLQEAWWGQATSLTNVENALRGL